MIDEVSEGGSPELARENLFRRLFNPMRNVLALQHPALISPSQRNHSKLHSFSKHPDRKRLARRSQRVFGGFLTNGRYLQMGKIAPELHR
jgi:hypothetical protein